MREIVLDTETTGFNAKGNDRIVEIGCVELMNLIPTGNHYHQYINPERDMPQEAFRVHGLSTEFLQKYPTFGEIISGFKDFIGDDILVIHNASFDVGFINAEFKRYGFPPIRFKRVVDTLEMARNRFPGQPANLDALCRRFDIDNGARDLHGALLDSQLLAEVYLELKGGKQPDLVGAQKKGAKSTDSSQKQIRVTKDPRPTRIFSASEEELEAHKNMLSNITDPIWSDA